VGALISNVLPKANTPETEEIASLLRQKILDSKGILESHPVNTARKEAGKKHGNMIWPWGGGKKPSLPTFKSEYGLNAAVISAVDLVKGIGIYSGMKIIDVPGVTGQYDTNYEGKANAALEAVKKNDFVFVHVEAPDEAGHEKDYNLKVKTIEDLDEKVVGRILKGLKEPCAIAVLPDHATPIKVGTHTRDPVPFAIRSPFLVPDHVRKFDEFSAKEGGFGEVEQEQFMSLFLSSGGSRKD
jgi:2,3-bisphosphoglycerate-independent phosphoglycerate mutase